MPSSTSRRDHAGTAPGPLPAAELLAAWEQGREQSKVARTLTLLSRGLPAAGAEALADLPVGDRDARLLQLRELSFGPVAECLARCPACEATVEFAMPVREILTERPAETEGVVEWQGIRLRVRPATSRDQLSLAGLVDPEAMVQQLLRRCAVVMEAPPGVAAELVPDAAADAVAAEMARLDPGADLRFTLSCPSCNTTWTSPFDVASYVWSEVDVAARRLLGEVHALATAYGWSEAEILGLTPARRRAYLEMTGSR